MMSKAMDKQPATFTPDCWVVTGFASSFGPEIFPAQRDGALADSGLQWVKFLSTDRPALLEASKKTAEIFGNMPKVDRTNVRPHDIFNTADEALTELRRRLDVRTRNMAKHVDDIYCAMLLSGALKI